VVDGDYLITPFEEEMAAQWSKALIEEGVSIIEMNRKVPVLEDLFLQLTGSEHK
jgi:ABC-2 type transport system ATP-binding protein